MTEQLEITLPAFKRGYHLITDLIERKLPPLPEKGLVNILLPHTSAGISLNENADPSVRIDFESFMNSKKKEELDKTIAEENLNKEEIYNFIQRSFEQGRVETNGTEVSTILPPMSMFTPNNERQEKKNKVIDKLLEFFDKFFSITSK